MRTWYVYNPSEMSVHFHRNAARTKRMRALLDLPNVKWSPQKKGPALFMRCSWGSYDPDLCAYTSKEDAQKVVDRLTPHGFPDFVVLTRAELFKELDLEDVYWQRLADLPDLEAVEREKAKASRQARQAARQAEREAFDLAVKRSQLAPPVLNAPVVAI